MTLDPIRARIDAAYLADEEQMLAELTEQAGLDRLSRDQIVREGADLVAHLRAQKDPGLMEVFLSEYGLSTDEGVALMCLAEALLRVPDAPTIDALIEDKIAPSDWGQHLGKSSSSLVNASTWALMLTGRVLDDRPPGLAGTLRAAVKRMGEPLIRTAVARAMREMGRQFVLGETIDTAMTRAAKMEAKGFTYSYDMLGEAARTEADALRYLEAYSTAIARIARAATHPSVTQNPGISVKLSALHPRYEEAQHDRVMAALVPRLTRLAREAAAHNMGLNIDAEEADRLSLSLDVMAAVMADPQLADWQGFGLVVQAYGPRAGHVIDWAYAMAAQHDRRIMLRLVKGAYWDAEIKRAQVLGLDGFPVFTRKAVTDISYIANARKLLGMTDRIYPQFATHNAHTIAAIRTMADAGHLPRDAFEFQRLHGMGEAMHHAVMQTHATRCRIYAPVGAHRDLLAYLVRRLLENGANSSFVNQIVDHEIAPEMVAADPWDHLGPPAPIAEGPDLFAPQRRNSAGRDLTHAPTRARIDAARDPFRSTMWHATPLPAFEGGARRPVIDPATGEAVGDVRDGSEEAVVQTFARAAKWDRPVAERAAILREAADAYEAHYGELFALLHREAGKTLPDAEGELREAVDFLRYYAAEAEAAGETDARGIWVCISPWNFPLAIFTGQIAAALATGNAVIAKPAEQTSLIAFRAVQLLHAAGVPDDALQLLPGGGEVGAALTAHPDVGGVAFTGSTGTARAIRRALAENAAPGTPLIAETGGLNAMVIDSTALPEAAVADAVASAFQSAGQRCSALRFLYVQEDVADHVIPMLRGAMDALQLGAPWDLSTDLGPVIDDAAAEGIRAHIDAARAQGRILHEIPAPGGARFVPPTLIALPGIEALDKEVFGPVLHLATFKAQDLDQVIDAINAKGFGLTFGLHTRIDDRVQHIVDRIEVGNTYVNRNQIGAVVGSQPFGGEGLSGTGPKAGGPRYLTRFRAPAPSPVGASWDRSVDIAALQKTRDATPAGTAIETRDLPGPTGESNRLSLWPKGPVLCLGPGAEASAAQARAVRDMGGQAVEAGGSVAPDLLMELGPFAAALWWGDAATGRAYERALAARPGPLVPLVTNHPDPGHVLHERHVCVDTTAAGGNAALLAEVGAG